MAKAKAGKAHWIHFRVQDDLTDRLDAHAAQLGLNRSEAARVLLDRALGEDLDNAVAKQAIFRMGGLVRRASARVMGRIAEELPDEILRLMREEEPDGSVQDDDEPPDEDAKPRDHRPIRRRR